MGLDPRKLRDFATAYAEAWCSKSPEAVASFYARDARFCANLGETIRGRAAVAEMAAGFYADFRDLVVRCDSVRAAGMHAIFLWTLEGHHAQTKAFVKIEGWEEWDVTETADGLKVDSSLGWFDIDDYERQVRPAGM